jgi:hypothetical protein
LAKDANKPNKAAEDAALGLDFMTMGRPLRDFHREYTPEMIEEMPKKKIDKLQKQHNDEGEKHFKKDAKDFPDWTWVISRKGFKMYQRRDLQMQKRDVENLGMYWYNDTYGYGIQEVLENHVSSRCTLYQLVPWKVDTCNS